MKSRVGYIFGGIAFESFVVTAGQGSQKLEDEYKGAIAIVRQI